MKYTVSLIYSENDYNTKDIRNLFDTIFKREKHSFIKKNNPHYIDALIVNHDEIEIAKSYILAFLIALEKSNLTGEGMTISLAAFPVKDSFNCTLSLDKDINHLLYKTDVNLEFTVYL